MRTTASRRAVTAVLAVAATASCTAAEPLASSSTTPSIAPTSVRIIGRAVRVSVSIRGWHTGMRWRMFVDGRYNSYSADPRLGLVRNVSPGRHRVALDLVDGPKHTRVVARAASQVLLSLYAASGPVIAAAGDIACDPDDPAFAGGAGTEWRCQQVATAKVVQAADPAAVLPLGDEQYECGSLAAFRRSYGPSWGRFMAISLPIPGNAEYGPDGGTAFTPDCDATPGSGYLAYFGVHAGAGSPYYSYDIGGWHFVALDSECASIGGCGQGSLEETWLRADLAAHPAACTLAYWHRPRWDPEAGDPGAPPLDVLWRDLVAADVDVLLTGHDHAYARLAPLDADGTAAAGGTTEFVVGTGGRDIYGLKSPSARVRAFQRVPEFGVLLLTLHPSSYEWQFMPVDGGTFTDYGAARCRRGG